MIRRANFRHKPFKPHICLDLWTCQLQVTINMPVRRDFKSREAANFKAAKDYVKSINPDAPYENPGAAVKALYTTFGGELCTN